MSDGLFGSTFQGGAVVDVFSAHGSNPTSNWKIVGAVQRVFDKSVKGYILRCDGGPTAKMQLPKDERKVLGLVQPYVVLQISIPSGKTFSMELSISDTSRSRRRLLFSTAFREVVSTPLHTRIPLGAIERDVWLNLTFDLSELASHNFVGARFGRLETITLGAVCRLRRIFTLREPPAVPSGEAGDHLELPLPRGFELPPGTVSTTILYSMHLAHSVVHHSDDDLGVSDGSTPFHDTSTGASSCASPVFPPSPSVLQKLPPPLQSSCHRQHATSAGDALPPPHKKCPIARSPSGGFSPCGSTASSSCTPLQLSSGLPTPTSQLPPRRAHTSSVGASRTRCEPLNRHGSRAHSAQPSHPPVSHRCAGGHSAGVSPASSSALASPVGSGASPHRGILGAALGCRSIPPAAEEMDGGGLGSATIQRKQAELQQRRQRLQQLEDSFERQYGDIRCAVQAFSNTPAAEESLPQPHLAAPLNPCSSFPPPLRLLAPAAEGTASGTADAAGEEFTRRRLSPVANRMAAAPAEPAASSSYRPLGVEGLRIDVALTHTEPPGVVSPTQSLLQRCAHHFGGAISIPIADGPNSRASEDDPLGPIGDGLLSPQSSHAGRISPLVSPLGAPWRDDAPLPEPPPPRHSSSRAQRGLQFHREAAASPPAAEAEEGCSCNGACVRQSVASDEAEEGGATGESEFCASLQNEQPWRLPQDGMRPERFSDDEEEVLTSVEPSPESSRDWSDGAAASEEWRPSRTPDGSMPRLPHEAAGGVVGTPGRDFVGERAGCGCGGAYDPAAYATAPPDVLFMSGVPLPPSPPPPPAAAAAAGAGGGAQVLFCGEGRAVARDKPSAPLAQCVGGGGVDCSEGEGEDEAAPLATHGAASSHSIFGGGGNSQRLYTPPVVPVGMHSSVSGASMRSIGMSMSYASPPHVVLPTRRRSSSVAATPTAASAEWAADADAQEPHGAEGEEDAREELDLMYDPMLNCYYDPKTNKYYELK